MTTTKSDSQKSAGVPKTKLTGPEAVRFIMDVKTGLSDAQLQEKYNMSGRTFLINKTAAKEIIDQYKARKSQPKIKINAREIVTDIKAGMDDDGIMIKYDLSQRQLQRLFRKIIGAGYLSASELAARLSVTKSQVAEAFMQLRQEIGEDETGQTASSDTKKK